MKKHSASWIETKQGPIAMNRTARQTLKKRFKLEHLPKAQIFPKIGKWVLKVKKTAMDRLNDLLK